VSVSGGAAKAEVYARAFRFLKSAYGIRGAMVWHSDSDARERWRYKAALGEAIGICDENASERC
jgi:hypothetical protein